MRTFLLIYTFSLFGILFSIQNKSIEQSIEDGYMIYDDFCIQCHGPNGIGFIKTIPPLANSDFLLNINKSISIIKYGAKGPIIVNGKEYEGNSMISQGLDSEEISDVLNYIKNNWGNSNEIQITAEDVNNIINPI
ncbi:MAG: cytochrome c [Flavobacteriaceae bacterium]|nr:cytochrome c [Flavobacteriaceae bacterium]